MIDKQKLRELMVAEIKRSAEKDIANGALAHSTLYCTWWFKFAIPDIPTAVFRKELREMGKEGLVKCVPVRKGNLAWRLISSEKVGEAME